MAAKPLFLIFLLSSSSIYCSAISTVTSSQPLFLNQTLVSSNQVFELGFFSPKNSTNQYLGIWYKGDSPRSVVWVANREKPLSLTDTSAVLQISSNGNLELLNGEPQQSSSSVTWSTNVDLPSNTTNNTTFGVLLDNGNFVLRNVSSGENLWQSFHHPCDTLLPGSFLGFNVKTGESYKLTSWRSETDPSPGNFTVGIAKKTAPELVLWFGSKLYGRSGPWDKLKFTGMPDRFSTYRSPYNLVEDVEKGTTYLNLENGFNNSVSSKLRILPKGVGVIMLKDKDNHWHTSLQGDSTPCSVYGRCGPFGVCKITESPMCECLRGFRPKSQQEWDKGNWTGGCVRRTELLCQKNGTNDEFGMISKISIPDFYEYVEAASSNDTCRTWCLSNCSCIAYSYVGGIGCLVWSNTIIDVRLISTIGDVLFFRLAHSESLGEERHSSKPKIIVIVLVAAVSVGAALLGAIVYVLQRRKAKRKENSTNNDFNRGDKPPELHFFELDSILIATNKFSFTNKLGQGGFGSVYKAQLQGKEVAVKRLSSSSSQGEEEFRNEMILISKLQHRNLVRLIGCCIEKQEKLLIYEFMLNKSLDTFIFDERKRSDLNWATRFNIIDGIARGLVYLHRDSSLKVIHRDLKVSNILLDEHMNPKISDFGLARVFEGTFDQVNTHRVVGTIGYMAPEYALSGIFSEKSDVFSYGVLILEIVSGKKNTGFSDGDQYQALIAHAWQLWSENREKELVDKALGESYNESEATRCIHIGLLCVQDSALDRPSMAQVAYMLSNQVFNESQPKQPIFTFPTSFDPATQQGSRCSVNEATMSLIQPR